MTFSIYLGLLVLSESCQNQLKTTICKFDLHAIFYKWKNENEFIRNLKYPVNQFNTLSGNATFNHTDHFQT